MQTILFEKKKNKVKLYNGVYSDNGYVITILENVGRIAMDNNAYVVYDADNNPLLSVPIKKTNIIYKYS